LLFLPARKIYFIDPDQVIFAPWKSMEIDLSRSGRIGFLCVSPTTDMPLPLSHINLCHNITWLGGMQSKFYCLSCMIQAYTNPEANYGRHGELAGLHRLDD
jgi:hypothetical protein